MHRGDFVVDGRKGRGGTWRVQGSGGGIDAYEAFVREGLLGVI